MACELLEVLYLVTFRILLSQRGLLRYKPSSLVYMPLVKPIFCLHVYTTLTIVDMNHAISTLTIPIDAGEQLKYNDKLGSVAPFIFISW